MVRLICMAMLPSSEGLRATVLVKRMPLGSRRSQRSDGAVCCHSSGSRGSPCSSQIVGMWVWARYVRPRLEKIASGTSTTT